MGDLINNSASISQSVKSYTYDQLCKAYIEGRDMSFSLFGRREHGYHSVAEYVGYGFIKMALDQGVIQETKQEKLGV